MSLLNRRQPFNCLRNEPNFSFLVVIIPETPACFSSLILRSRVSSSLFVAGHFSYTYISSRDERLLSTLIWKRIKERERLGFDPSTLGAVGGE